MLSAFLLSWATDDTDTTDLHRFRFPFSHSYTLPLWERGLRSQNALSPQR